MRPFLILGWLLLPIAGVAYHLGPGQRGQALDDAAAQIRNAERHAAAGDWKLAEVAFGAALDSMPPDRIHDLRRIRLERAKARLHVPQLPEAHMELTALVEGLSANPMSADSKGESPHDANSTRNEGQAGGKSVATSAMSATDEKALLDESREALAHSQYYLTWLMRLEGEPRDEWLPEIEASRQVYRLLAEEAAAEGDDVAAQRHQENLESAIRLARMDLKELQALPLPSQCKGCCSGQCRGKGKGQSKKPGRSNSNGQKKPQDARGASSGPPPDGQGS